MTKRTKTNPWGYHELDAEEAGQMIDLINRVPFYEPRIERRSGRDFLVIYYPERDTCVCGAELIAVEDVEAVRAHLAEGGGNV